MRLKRLKRALKNKGQLPYLITDLVNIRYLTGFTGSSAYLLVAEPSSYFISDARYEEYAISILPKEVEFSLQVDGFQNNLITVFKKFGFRELFLEEHSISLSTFSLLKKSLKGIKLHQSGDAVNEMRIEKDEGEITVLRESARLVDKCLAHILKLVKPGMFEWDIAVEIEYFYRKNGCRKTSFDSIVASGPGTSMPHYETSMTKKIEANSPLMIDMGCEYQGYNSDLTRTVFVGKVESKIMEIFSIVREAQEAAIAAAMPGRTAGRLDRIARSVIEKRGYGECFGHSLGHGLGLDIHELPALKRSSDIKLKKNMVITIEPGIYLPGIGGVRIEDMVLITQSGHEVLTSSRKEIII
jgi:Xaa-Pro aminopeptidase